MVAMRREDGTYTTPQFKKKPAAAAAMPNWMWPVAVTLVCIAAIGVGGFLYFNKIEKPGASKVAASTPATPAPSSPERVPPAPAPAPAATATPAPAPAPAPPPPPSPPPIPPTEKFAAETVPFVTDRFRLALAKDYTPAADYKALALVVTGNNAFVTGQQNEEAARSSALEQCQKKADAVQPPRKCELYAVGNIVVYPHGRPPMPPTPWVKHDQIIEKPFAAKDVPLARDSGKTRLESGYTTGRKTKAIALGPGGQFFFYTNQESAEEATRRTLEGCGAVAGVPCMIVALDDGFVVPVPTTLKATGFFRATGTSSIAPDSRQDVARRLTEASTGWNAVAVGASGRPGLALGASNEQDAVNDALGNCVKHDSDCHVIAIGPFSVGPN
jgi:adenylate cyclase